MVIDIDRDAIKWIQAKGSQLTVKLLDIQECCAPGVQEVVAVPGKPKALQQFNEYHVDNLVIYVQKIMCQKDRLTLRMSGILFLKSISAKME